MKRFWNLRTLRLALLCLSLTQLAAAQFTTVSGTVVDPNGIAYAGGTIVPLLVTPSTPKFTATNLPYSPPTQAVGLSSTGSFVMQLADNTALTPGGTTWNFKVCSALATVQPAGGTGSVCFSLAAPITISGATQSISSQLNAVAVALTSSSLPSTGTANQCLLSTVFAPPVWGACSGGSSTNWSALVPGTGTITAGTYNVGTGSSLLPTGSGVISATLANGSAFGPLATALNPFATNGGNNATQNALNFITSTTNSVGLTVTPSNPATTSEKFEITGGSYTGNAATATVASNLVGCTGATAGDICYYTGAAWAKLAGNSSGTNFLQETAAGVPSWAAAGGGAVNVNGSGVSSPNFNGTTPAAGANGINVTYQASGSNVSAEIVGDGNSAHFLNGTGAFSAPSGGGISGLTVGQRLTTNGTTGIQTKGPTFDTTQLTGATWDARLLFCLTNAAALNGGAGTCDMTNEAANTSSTTAANGVVAGNGQLVILPPVTLTLGNSFFFNVTGNNSGFVCMQLWTCVVDASNNGSAGTFSISGTKSFLTGVKAIGGRLNKQSGNEINVTGLQDWVTYNWIVNAGQVAIQLNSGANQAIVHYNLIDQSGSAAILANNNNNGTTVADNDIAFNLARDGNVNWNQNTQGTIGVGCSAGNCAAVPPTAHLSDHNAIHDNLVVFQYFAAADCNNPNFGTLNIASWSGSGTTSITFTYASAQPAGGLPSIGQVITGASFAVGGLNTTATVTASTTTTITATYGGTVTGSTGTGTITYTPTSTDTGCSEGIQTTDSVWYAQIKNNRIYNASKEGIAFDGVGVQVTGNYCESCGLHSINGSTSGAYAWEKSTQVQASPGYVGDTVIANNIAINTSSTALRYCILVQFSGTASYTFQDAVIANNVCDGSGGAGGLTSGITLNAANLTGTVTLKDVRINGNTVAGNITTPFNPNSYTNITGVGVCSGNGWNSSTDAARGANDIASFSSSTTCNQAEVDSAVYALGGVIGWPATTPDTGLSRDSAGVVDVGNGTAGNTSGTVQATAFKGVGTNGGVSGTEGTGANAGTAGAGTDLLYPDSTNHCWHENVNNVDIGCDVAGGTAAVTSGDLASYTNTTPYRIQDSNVVAANVTTQTANGAANQVCTYTGANKVCVPGAVALTSLATEAADTVVMNATGGSATPTAVVMPACAASGHADVYDPSTHTWTCNATSGGSSFNPLDSTVFWQRTEFCSTNALNGRPTFWKENAIGAGGAIAVGTPDANHPCVTTLSSGTTANTGELYVMTDSPTLSAMSFFNLSTTTNWEMDFNLKLSATTTQLTYYGFFANGFAGTALPPANFIGLRYDTAIGDTNFTCVTISGSTATATSSGIAADTSWHSVKLSSTVAGTIKCQVDAGSVISISTNVPTNNMDPGVEILAPSSITQQSVNINRNFIQFTGLTR